MKKEYVGEIFWLRSISCLAVVLLHSLTSALALYPDSKFENLFLVLRLTLLFATPAFIFISEFLLAKSYSSTIPKDFLSKRAKILLLPYLFISVIFAFVESGSDITFTSFLIESAKNIFLADSIVYFVVIIFQFFLLHKYLYKHLNKWSPSIVIPIALLINILYLSIFNFYTPSYDSLILNYIWERGYWIPFPGWIFYFALGYYCGKNYGVLVEKLKQFKLLVLLAPFVTFSLVVVLKYLHIIEPSSSKRIDILFYTVSMIFFIFYLSHLYNKVPKWILFTSEYSFSIFLLHKIFLVVIPPLAGLNFVSYTIIYFVISLLLAITIAILVNKIPFGKYLVGNIRRYKKPEKPNIRDSKAV
ncbi:acyltransferase family protein [Peribacillus simplex]|uniref:acyltransferase family protein n=1 Tax=Peribacillus simplex TaxID=1478 RepID=UPI00203D0804|nr:acyltransferase family protein [Peribacillus simplex]MCM3673375.1 acyltransferase family protein [Peribacillus simplex]